MKQSLIALSFLLLFSNNSMSMELGLEPLNLNKQDSELKPTHSELVDSFLISIASKISYSHTTKLADSDKEKLIKLLEKTTSNDILQSPEHIIALEIAALNCSSKKEYESSAIPLLIDTTLDSPTEHTTLKDELINLQKKIKIHFETDPISLYNLSKSTVDVSLHALNHQHRINANSTNHFKFLITTQENQLKTLQDEQQAVLKQLEQSKNEITKLEEADNKIKLRVATQRYLMEKIGANLQQLLDKCTQDIELLGHEKSDLDKDRVVLKTQIKKANLSSDLNRIKSLNEELQKLNTQSTANANATIEANSKYDHLLQLSARYDKPGTTVGSIKRAFWS